jgi:hypothetical protein
MYPLLKNLPSVVAAVKKYNNPDAELEVAEEADEAAADADVDSGPNFNHYVGEICVKVRARLIALDKDRFKHIRISKNIREFGTRVVVELIDRIAPQIELRNANHPIKSEPSIKTIKEHFIRFAFKSILLDAGIDYTEFDEFVCGCVKLFYAHKEAVKAEKAAKAAK